MSSSSRSSFKLSGKIYQKNPSPQSEWKWTLRPGSWVIAESPQGKRIRFMLSERRGQLSFSLRGCLWLGEWVQASQNNVQSRSKRDLDLVAEFPGKVRKILVQEKSGISEGQVLILIEAMKMEFSVRAPAAGKVLKILVQEGQQLSPGDRLIDWEAETGGG